MSRNAYVLSILGILQHLWETVETNKICQESRILPNTSIGSMVPSICQYQCEIDERCKGTCYPRFNGYVHDCYICYGDDLTNVTQDLLEAEMEFKRRPPGLFM